MASSFAQRESVLGELQIVRKIRETVRRWWGIELSFTDAKGFVVEHGKGILIPPSNRTCTACLGDRVGFQRCNESIEKAVRQFGSEPASARLLGPCHMGLEIVGAPISYGGERQGSLFACGFVVAEKAEAARPHAIQTTQRLQLPVVQPSEAFDTIARIDARDVPRLTDLIDTTVEEIAAYQNAVAERERNIQALRRELTARYRFADIVGKSAPMQRLYALLDKLVSSDITVLVTGENGTGKELIARALHYNGPRKDKAFVATNASALNDNLLESELFGHVKGAFTGAGRDKTGLFKVADGGTFFLDEVGDMSPAMQVKLLRVLQEGTFVPVGATKPDRVDVRVIAATNRDLREMVARRQFREDLFYRLHVVNIEVPPLRQRSDDLPLLTSHFLQQAGERTSRPVKRLHPDLLRSFYERRWPGNIRELENELDRPVRGAGRAGAWQRSGHRGLPVGEGPDRAGAARDAGQQVAAGGAPGSVAHDPDQEDPRVRPGPDRPGADQSGGRRLSTAAIVVIGNEILSAKVSDENGPWLSRELRGLGVEVRRIETVPDEVPVIVDSLRRGLESAKWVFTSGGIGPTHDDVTIAAVAQCFGRRVVPDERILAALRGHLGDRLNPALRRLADVPAGEPAQRRVQAVAQV